MRGRVYLLPGRHQPPHNDHLEIIKRALELIGGATLHLALITGAGLEREECELEREAQAMHAPDRTPYTFVERSEMIEAMLPRSLAARVRVIPLPRPESAWSFITQLFPEPRTWIVPDCGEHFDELKTEFFRARGDEVLRVKILPTTDGRLVRALARRRAPELSFHVPPAVHAALTTIKKGDPE